MRHTRICPSHSAHCAPRTRACVCRTHSPAPAAAAAPGQRGDATLCQPTQKFNQSTNNPQPPTATRLQVLGVVPEVGQQRLAGGRLGGDDVVQGPPAHDGSRQRQRPPGGRVAGGGRSTREGEGCKRWGGVAAGVGQGRGRRARRAGLGWGGGAWAGTAQRQTSGDKRQPPPLGAQHGQRGCAGQARQDGLRGYQPAAALHNNT